MNRRAVTYSIIRPNEWPWGMAIWFALGDHSYGRAVANGLVPVEGEYLGTAPIPVQA